MNSPQFIWVLSPTAHNTFATRAIARRLHRTQHQCSLSSHHPQTEPLVAKLRSCFFFIVAGCAVSGCSVSPYWSTFARLSVASISGLALVAKLRSCFCAAACSAADCCFHLWLDASRQVAFLFLLMQCRCFSCLTPRLHRPRHSQCLYHALRLCCACCAQSLRLSHRLCRARLAKRLLCTP
eukprot:SAG31_NODE_474_length_15176_cov_7.362340_3_plen_181_part_00